MAEGASSQRPLPEWLNEKILEAQANYRQQQALVGDTENRPRMEVARAKMAVVEAKKATGEFPQEVKTVTDARVYAEMFLAIKEAKEKNLPLITDTVVEVARDLGMSAGETKYEESKLTKFFSELGKRVGKKLEERRAVDRSDTAEMTETRQIVEKILGKLSANEVPSTRAATGPVGQGGIVQN